MIVDKKQDRVTTKAGYVANPAIQQNQNTYITDLESTYITGANMALALTTYRSLYQTGTVLICSDNSNNNYIQGHVYRFNDTEWIDITDLAKPFTRLDKKADYLYDIYYSAIDYDNAEKYFRARGPMANLGQCSMVRNGDFIGRNLDWLYSEDVEFVVQIPENSGRYATMGVVSTVRDGNNALTKSFVESGAYSDLYNVLPFMIVDGWNSQGVYCGTNVVPKQKNNGDLISPSGTIEKTICTLMLPRFVIDNFATATEAVNYISTHLALYPSRVLSETYQYEQHFIIADNTKTYLVEFVNSQIVVTEKNYITNFYDNGVTYNQDGKVYTPADVPDGHLPTVANGITSLGSGLERYNLIVDNYASANTAQGMRDLMTELLYTRAYSTSPDVANPAWYTEFVGINNLTVDSTPTQFAQTYAAAGEKFSNRSRDRESANFGTWQTVHSCVYDYANMKLSIVSQEDTTQIFNYDFSFTITKTSDLINDGNGESPFATIKDIAGNIFTIDSVIESSDWELSTDIEGYNYSAGIEIEGAEATDVSIVSFSAEDADSGNFASICSTTTDLVTIYSKVAQDITIPTIVTFKSSQDLTLEAPVISISNNTLTITDDTVNVNYKIYEGDDLVDTTSNKTVDLTAIITIEGVAQAITVISTKQGFIDSPASNAINYTKPSLVAPSISISDDTLTITDTNVFEVQFKIYADNDLVDTTSDTTIDLTQLFTDGETYAIKVCATNPNFNDSGFSLTISYQSKLVLILDNMVGDSNEQISMLVNAPTQETAFSNTQNEKLLFGTVFNNVANKIWFRWNEEQTTNPTLTLNFFLSNLGSATNVACKISLNNATLFEGDLQVITGEAYQATKQFTFPTSTTEFSFFNELKIEFTDTTQQDAVLDYIDLTISNADNALILNRGNMLEMEGVKRSNGLKREFLTVYEDAGVFKYKGGGDDQNFVTLLETNNFKLSSVGGETFRFAQNSVRTYWDRISSKPKTNTTFHVTCYINQSNNLYVNYTQNETAINLTNNVIYAKKSHWNGSIGYTELIAGTTFNFHPFLVNWDTTYSYPVLGYQWTLKLNNEDIPDEFIDLIPVRDQYHSTRTTNTLGFGYFALHKSGYVLFFPDVSSTYFINLGKGRDVTAFASLDGLSVRVYYRFNNTIYCKTLTRTSITRTDWTLGATPETYNNYKEAVESDDIKYGLTNNYQIAFISQENN